MVVSGNERSQCFADFFEQKVKSIVENTAVDVEVYSGDKKVVAEEVMFISRHDKMKCKCLSNIILL